MGASKERGFARNFMIFSIAVSIFLEELCFCRKAAAVLCFLIRPLFIRVKLCGSSGSIPYVIYVAILFSQSLPKHRD